MKTSIFAAVCAAAFATGFYATASTLLNVEPVPASLAPHPHRIEVSAPHGAFVESPAKHAWKADAGTPIKLVRHVSPAVEATMHCNAPRMLANSSWQHVQECDVY